MASKKVFLSVIVPVYNEEKTVTRIINRILKHLPPRSEIVIVNDGSTDSTPKKLARLKSTSRIRIFNLKHNRGKGYATRYGFQQARGQILLIQDADLEYHPKYYHRLLQPIKDKQAQVVYGSRLMHHRLNLHTLRTIPMPFHFVANKLLSWFTNLIFNCHLTDMETCYKVFTRSVYQQLNLTKDGFGIDPEITAQVLLAGYQIHEVPITTKPRTYAEGKKITWHDGYRTIIILLKHRLDKFHLACLGIILLTAFFRFWDFKHRYGLWSDQARDAIVGRLSLAHHTLPLIGSFSSAGPFTFGPYWYWYSALMNLIFPSHLGYWIGMGLTSILMTAALIWLANKLSGRFMALTAGLIAASSLALTQSSLGSTQHSAVGPIITFSLIFIYLYLQTGKLKHLLATTFLISFATNFHYQAIYLFPMLFLLVLVKWPQLKNLPLVALAWLLPFTPLVLFDLQHQWWNLAKFLDYYRFGQHRIYVPNRWLTYAGLFWPNYWAKVAGFFPLLAYITMFFIGILFVTKFIQRRLSQPILIYGLGFLFAIIWFRYFKAQRVEGYIVYAQPLIIIFSAWLIDHIRHINPTSAYLMASLLIGGNLYGMGKEASYFNPYRSINHLQTTLISTYPDSTFSLYDQDFRTTGCSISLSLLLDDDHLSVTDGQKVGVCQAEYCPPDYPIITTVKTGNFDCHLVDINHLEDQELKKKNWILVSPEEVHRMTVEWWKTEPSLQ